MAKKVEKLKENDKYGGKPYGEIKCPFFTNEEITDAVPELNKETICTKCWSLYDYNCYYPKFFDCSQYGEMLKTINPEYLKSLIDAMRTSSDFELTQLTFTRPELNTAEKIINEYTEDKLMFTPRDTIAKMILDKLAEDIKDGICFEQNFTRKLETGDIEILAWYGVGDPSTVEVNIKISEER